MKMEEGQFRQAGGFLYVGNDRRIYILIWFNTKFVTFSIYENHDGSRSCFSCYSNVGTRISQNQTDLSTRQVYREAL